MSQDQGVIFALAGLLEDLPEEKANAFRRESIRSDKPVEALIREALLEKAERLSNPSPDESGEDDGERRDEAA